jgi:inorganic pyrophosphatase/exopolyphosphatase
MIYITAKINPDKDGVACIKAYEEYLLALGKKVQGVIFGKAQVEPEFVMKKLGVKIPNGPKKINPDDKFILVDASSFMGMPEFINANNTIEMIDHRDQIDDVKLKNIKIQNEPVVAAATLIAKKFIASSIKMSHVSALMLYEAICSHSSNFKSPYYTLRDKKAVEFIKKNYQIPKNFISSVFAFTQKQIFANLNRHFNQDYKVFNLNNSIFSVGQIDICSKEQIYENKEKLLKIIHSQAKKYKSKYNFIIATDFESGQGFYIADELETQKLLTKLLDIKFIDSIATSKHLALRKDTMSKIKNRI